MIKIIIFSDIRIYCEGLSQILSKQDTLEVVGAESSLDEAVSKVEKLMPHVILLDMTMIGSCGLARRFMQLCPHVKIVALAVPEEEKNIIECAEAGISSYVAREASIDELIKTVISAKQGEFCCPPKIAAFLFNKVQALARRSKENYLSSSSLEQDIAFQDLTRREKQILSLMAEGLSNKQISKSLLIEVSTVKNHVHNILVKLEVHSRIHAVSLFQSIMQADRSRSFGLVRSKEIYF
jgi:two-component system nitrate/nitrite response regulator NarL